MVSAAGSSLILKTRESGEQIVEVPVLVQIQRQEETNDPTQRKADRATFPLLGLFVLLRSSTEWMRPTHIGEENLLYSVYQIKMLISSRNTLTNTRILFHQISEHHKAQSS